jgi:hypothetical protein
MSVLTTCVLAVAFGTAVAGCTNMNSGYRSGHSTTPRSPELAMPYPTSPSATQSGAADKAEGSGQAVPGPTKGRCRQLRGRQARPT